MNIIFDFCCLFFTINNLFTFSLISFIKFLCVLLSIDYNGFIYILLVQIEKSLRRRHVVDVLFNITFNGYTLLLFLLDISIKYLSWLVSLAFIKIPILQNNQKYHLIRTRKSAKIFRYISITRIQT